MTPISIKHCINCEEQYDPAKTIAGSIDFCSDECREEYALSCDKRILDIVSAVNPDTKLTPINSLVGISSAAMSALGSMSTRQLEYGITVPTSDQVLNSVPVVNNDSVINNDSIVTNGEAITDEARESIKNLLNFGK